MGHKPLHSRQESLCDERQSNCKTLAEPVPPSPIDFAEPDEFDEQFRQANIEAVRRQMCGTTP